MLFTWFFRIALLFPLVGGVISIFLPLPYGFLAPGLPFYGPRYILFAATVLLWSKSRSEHALRAASLLLPCLFVVVLLMPVPEFHPYPRPPIEWASLLHELVVEGLLTLAVGYAYVALGWSLYGLIVLVRRSLAA